jgi:cysteine desulfurase
MTVYADNAATTQMSQTALDTIIPLLQNTYGNASSIHSIGQDALKVLDTARSKVAAALNAEAREIYFTSGGTESDNWAIVNAAELGAKQGKKHLISSAIEHHAVIHTLDKLKKNGFEVTLLPVTNEGFVTPESLRAAIREDTALVTIMFANNEVGTIQPIAELAAIAHEKKITFHTDAVQAVAHVPVDVKALDVDMLSLSGHKFHGPKGVGALYVRKSQKLTPFMEGGAQERSRRAGTENVPGIASMAAALEHAAANLEANGKAVSALRDRLIAGLTSALPKVILNGAKDGRLRLPGNVNVCFEGIEGESLLLLLDMAGICGSSGSACTSGSLDPSHVLLALGLPHGTAHGSLRLSLGEYNTDAEIDYILEQVPPIVERLRAMSPIWEKIKNSE